MYHPYFRGKQYELITVREMAPVMKAAGFRPVIEPVKEGLNGLHRALKTVAALVERRSLSSIPITAITRRMARRSRSFSTKIFRSYPR
jgi:hypothetical protein